MRPAGPCPRGRRRHPSPSPSPSPSPNPNPNGRCVYAGQAATSALQRELREQEEAWRHLDTELEHTLNMAEMEQEI